MSEQGVLQLCLSAWLKAPLTCSAPGLGCHVLACSGQPPRLVRCELLNTACLWLTSSRAAAVWVLCVGWVRMAPASRGQSCSSAGGLTKHSSGSCVGLGVAEEPWGWMWRTAGH